MDPAWDAFLRGEGSSGHGAEIYCELDELADSVATFLAAGFDAGEPCLVVATPEHLAAFASALAARGWDSAAIGTRASFLAADAESTLEAVLEDGVPSPAAFERVLGTLIDGLGGSGPPPRIFGEMVSLLCERGDEAAALQLERLWNDARRRRPFSLLCGYRLDVFDARAQSGPLPALCRVHSHVLPAHDTPRFTAAVDRALTDVLGPAAARDVYYVVGGRVHERVPVAQSALRWVTENMPAQAARVLSLARSLYFETTPAGLGA